MENEKIVNEGASEQMVEKLSTSELVTLNQANAAIQVSELQAELAKSRWTTMLQELRLKYMLSPADSFDINTGVITRK